MIPCQVVDTAGPEAALSKTFPTNGEQTALGRRGPQDARRGRAPSRLRLEGGGLIFVGLLAAGCSQAQFAGDTPRRAQASPETPICMVSGEECVPPPPAETCQDGSLPSTATAPSLRRLRSRHRRPPARRGRSVPRSPS